MKKNKNRTIACGCMTAICYTDPIRFVQNYAAIRDKQTNARDERVRYTSPGTFMSNLVSIAFIIAETSLKQTDTSTDGQADRDVSIYSPGNTDHTYIHI